MNFDSIIQTNNEAVSFICQGELNEARTLLLRSISSMKSQLTNDNEITEKLPSHHVSTGADTEEICLESVPVPSLSSDQALQQRGLDCSLLSLFDRLFLIRKENAKNQRLVCATIVYNMAMLLHLASLSGKRCQIDKVVQLYSLCDTTIQDEKSRSSEACLLTLAALNNMAHINSMYFKAQETNEALTHLVSELAFLDRDTPIEENDLLVFHLNAFLHSSGQSFRFAPSA